MNESDDRISKLPSIELLESTHRFPSDYVFKVIGHSDDAFLARILAAVRISASLDADPPFTVRQTSQGKHVAVTLTVAAKSAQEVLSIYKSLIGLEGLVLLL